ncbi:MAG: TAXI family TRAP transporter solute-binding subunit [Deltaproteobacteria bacterium]|jgi:TRAP transporter TAXI family solute receptor|nr:TAXI family TRAP transporter solute-binding subunit [Deltaproteobacteria bacterium]
MKRTAILLTIILFALLELSEANDRIFVNIGTGGLTGVYYPAGGAISRMINRKSKVYGIKLHPESTDGSVYNINAVLNGDLELGLAQSDRQYQAYHGLAEWSQIGPRKELRSLFSIHPESITLVATETSEVKKVIDLIGKRVSIGNPGSGQMQNSKDVLAASGVSLEAIEAKQVMPIKAPELLKEGEIDAFFYTVGHPNSNIKEATTGCTKVNIIPITGPGIDALLQKHSYYSRTVIPADLYFSYGAKEDIETIGVKATLVASSKLDDNIVYVITKEVFDNLERFKTLHPALALLTRENMLQGLSAPIHQGALKYYKEAGLVKYINPDLIK